MPSFPATMYPGQLNSVSTTLNGSLAQASTSVTVTTVGNLLTNSSCPFLVMIGPSTGFDSTTEICICTAVSGSVLTITRAQGGSTAPTTWASGSLIACNFSSIHYANLVTNLNTITPTWRPLTATTDFSTTGASTSTITMNTDQTANIKTGYAIKYVFNSNTYYGQVTAITSGLLTFRGPPITTGAGLLTAISYGDESRVKAIPVLMPGYYEAATVSTYINSNILSPSGYEWELPSAGYCVGYTFQTGTTDGSSNGYIQLVVNGNNVCSTGATGILVNSTSLLTTGVAVNTVSSTNITISPGQFFEISVTAGTGLNATNGRLVAIFVIP